MKSALARQKQIQRIRRRGPVSNALSPASPLPSVATRVIGSTSTEAGSMADSITNVALQPLRILNPSGVREAYSGCTSGCDIWDSRTWARPSTKNQPKGAEAPSLPDLFIVRVFDLGGFYCPRYDFSHFNRRWTRICLGASFIVILLPIAKLRVK
jgi:hypothetical protein